MICPINLKLECDGILQIYFFSLWPHIISLDFQKETKCKPNFLCVWVGGFWVWGGGVGFNIQFSTTPVSIATF